MKHDEINTIVDNVLTDEDIAQIYKSVEQSTGNSFVDVHCQLNNFITIPKSIIDKFTESAKNVSKNNNLVLTEYCHARYQNTTSDCGKYSFKPSLFPHYDETFSEPRFTFDYQLNANIDWELVVEDKGFSLSNNQAVTFSGTHQIHWRTPTIFKDDQFVEMIFCHFTDPTQDKKSDELNKMMDEKAKHYRKIFYQNGGFSNEQNA